MTAPRLNAGGIIAGKYTVRSVLGNGGAIITYHCVSQSGQEVAVKLYDPAVASHATVMKSLEQAYAATNALPPNSAAPIIDAGYDPPTVAPYSVTEMLRLPSLAAQNRRFSPEELVSLLKGLARSLDLAHLRQVVHGAIKPTNVFVGPAFNPVIVTDFAANLPKAAIPSQEGFLSSAPWIAPEQAQSGSVTPAADVFGVGLLVFFALTGKNYWKSCQANFDLAGWQAELGAPRAPASARAAELGVPLSPTLDTVIWKALAADPTDRFKSIGELANTLEESLRSTVGGAATMALPMITGDAPSPLPANLKPQPPRHSPSEAPGGGATMALNLSDILPPGANLGGPPVPAGMAPGVYPDMRTSQQGMPAAYGDMRTSQQGMPAAYPGMDTSGLMQSPAYGQQQGYGQQGYGAQAYGQPAYAPGGHRDPGYPPPPGPNGSVGPGGQGGKSKVVPIVIGFTAVALLGAVATVIALKVRDAKPEETGPVAVPAEPTATAAATADPAPAETTEPATPPVEVEVTIACTPKCETVKVDGAEVDATKPLKLTVGTHEVELVKAGYVTQTEKLEVVEGAAMKKEFTLVADKPVATAPPVTTSKPPTTTTSRPPTTTTSKPPSTTKPCKKGGFIKKC